MKSQSKYYLYSLILAVLFSFTLNAQSDVTSDSTGYPGDGFSLEGALDLFKNSKSLEDFEKKLNSEDNSVNNLDLNEDGEVDYIRVIDNKEKKVHAIILQVPLSDKESQDVAVIGIEEQGKENTILQIVGDADVYGEETYVEPFEEEAKSDGKGGPSANARVARIVVNVFFWPSVRFIYHPSYVVYASPWRWRHYPSYWRPWRPHPWSVYHSRRAVYHRNYRRAPTHRVSNAHRVYSPHRRTSVTVRTRTTTVRTTNASRKVTTTNKKVTTTNKKAVTANKKVTTANNKATTANKKTVTANKKASTANQKAATANQKTVTANKKASTANKKATTANKKSSTANKKASTTNKKANTANKKTSTTNKKATSGNKSTKSNYNKASSANKKSTQSKSSQQKSKQHKSTQSKSAKQKSSQKKSSQHKSSKQGGKKSGNKGGGKGKKGHR
jgi:hypothetical protein